MEDYWSLVGIVLGASGFWQLTSYLLTIRQERKLKSAAAENLAAKTDSEVLRNWIAWSQKLEQRVKELEHVVQQLRNENNRLIERIADLIEHGERK